MSSEIVIIVPAFNEVENIPLLSAELLPIARDLNAKVLIVDNGSDDGTEKAANSVSGFHCLHREIACKTEALRAAIQESTEPLIATLDADLQEDPQNLPRMFELLKDADFVQAVRLNRADSFFIKSVPSRLYNNLVKLLFGVNFQDINCGLRVFRRDVLQYVTWFPGAHRLLPLMIHLANKRVLLYPVPHRKRRFGNSKFSSPSRFYSGVKDLLSLYRTLKS